MQEDFHYYASYAAAYLAGYNHEESLKICYCAQLVDLCSQTFLGKLKAPKNAATTQLQLELMNTKTDIVGLQNITRIWASFHFLPRDLYAKYPKRSKAYLNRYRLICGPNGDLLVETVKLAKQQGLEAVGLAMHVLADTWAHSHFAGTPSLVINNTNFQFYELCEEDGGTKEIPLSFKKSATAVDQPENHKYAASLFQANENSIMNLGHGRAGHLPDYSFIRYKYLPAWGNYNEIIKDNPADYQKAFAQMVYAMRYLRGEYDTFQKETYDTERIAPYIEEIDAILRKRQINACADWKAFGEKLSGQAIPDFDLERYESEYLSAEAKQKENSLLGRFFTAAMMQKSMVTNQIFQSKNLLAGYSKLVKVTKDE